MVNGRQAVRIIWGATKAITGQDMALVLFGDRSFEYIPHAEFAI